MAIYVFLRPTGGRRLDHGRTLHVEYAEQRLKYGILFILSPFYEYIYLTYVRVPVISRVNQSEYVIHVLLAASQEYVNTYSTRRGKTLYLSASIDLCGLRVPCNYQ